MKRLVLVVIALLVLGGAAYAADGDLIVNGNLGVGTTSAPTEKTEINGNLKVNGNVCVGGKCTGTLHVSGGLYGFCREWKGDTGNIEGCDSALAPASCVYICQCPAGYTKVNMSSLAAYWVACYKN